MNYKTLFKYKILALFLLAGASLYAKGQKEEPPAAQEPEPPNAVIDAAREAFNSTEFKQDLAPAAIVWSFETLLERVWYLEAIKVGVGYLTLDRAAMSAANLGDAYALQFKTEGINGKAVFNFYFAQYARNEGKNIAFRQIVATKPQNAASAVVGGLGEEEYYWYLQRAQRWEVINGRLEIHGQYGTEDIALYFSQAAGG